MTAELSSALTTLVWMSTGVIGLVYILLIRVITGLHTTNVELKGSTTTADNVFTVGAAQANAQAQQAAKDAAKANLEAEQARLERVRIEQQG